MQPTFESKILDHLGLVAAMYDELEIGTQIDHAIEQDCAQRIVSIGDAVKAMVLNGLGFVQQRLYVVPKFFETKPTEHLIAPGILPEHLHDDTLGRALDALYDYGVTALFRDVAAHAARRLELAPRFAHIDATSFHVHGTYNSDEETVEDGVIHVRQGYSRDYRPDLNQVVLELIVAHRAALPMLMQPLSGNSNDRSDFVELIRRHVDHLQQAQGVDFLVADSALYSADALGEMDRRSSKFITRVPETVKEARELIASVELATMQPLSEGYRYTNWLSSYAGVEQRWMVVFSEQARQRAEKSVTRRLQKRHHQDVGAFEKLTKRPFSCREDAERALEAFVATLKASRVEAADILECEHVNGTDMRVNEPRVSYRLCGRLALSEAYLAEQIDRKSLFILATNELDALALPPADLLAGYKGQVQVERGFRFLKDPVFLASSLFLKNEKRIMALLMVMTLCLLVYAALEWRIRQGLKAHEQTFPDQKGKPTSRPTARWVFECFVGIHVLDYAGQQLVLNLKEEHRVIVSVLGQHYEQLYSSHPT